MKKILLVEDDPDLTTIVRYNLENRGFSVVTSPTGSGILELCRRHRPDLVILDIMLPDADGLEICKVIRRDAAFGRIPVIFLSARAAEVDKVLGLELGANDYIVKPFSLRELVARIEVQLRAQSAPGETLRAGGIELDRSGKRVRLEGREVPLPATEFRLLEFLMIHPGAVFGRGQLLDAVWGQDRAVTERAVDVYVLRLRQKLEANPANPRLIRSTRGFGYSFESTTL
ncbi:MAG: response regulator [Bryobacteraceae bacterium]